VFLRSDHRENQAFRVSSRAEIAAIDVELLAFLAGQGKGTEQSGSGVTLDDVRGVWRPDDAALLSGPPSDWHILRYTILRSVATSPGAFLATAAQLKAKSPEYWQNRLSSSTWAVVQRGSDILGIAAAKPPSQVDDYALQEPACFIESVWIDPDMRGNGVGERLLTYIIEQQRKARIQKFYLWVFDYNAPAIRLYDRMHFKPTGRDGELPDEIQYLRAFDSDAIDNDELMRNAVARWRDRARWGIKYRLLTPDEARTHMASAYRLPGWQTAGSIARNLKACIGVPRIGKLVR
jgi:ribosomal protein S18 acetylase RimI-like enzyme